MSYRRPYPSDIPKEVTLASRIMIDLSGYDHTFCRKCEEIFETDIRLDGRNGRDLKEWIEIAVADIVSLYTANPTTLYGTINIGADYKAYHDMDRYTESQFEDFNMAYKKFATDVYFILGEKLEPYMNRAIDMGYSDMACSVNRFIPGALMLNVRAISPFPDHA